MKKGDIHESLGKSRSVIAKGMPPVGMGGGDLNDKLSLVWRPPIFLANGPGFRVELFTRGYSPCHIILDGA